MQKIVETDSPWLEIQKILKEIHAKNIVLICSKRTAIEFKLNSLFKFLLSKNVDYFLDIKSNPQETDINLASEFLKKRSPEIIIAVGGGSVLDTAKSARYLSNLTCPLIAIPTTSGTGSESTQFATYYNGDIKCSFDFPEILPEYVVLSEYFTRSLPPYIVAETGADALCQSIESYWSIASTNESRELSERAIKIITKNLKKAVISPDYDSRLSMLKASNISGRAINITRTTAAHSVSYPMTSFFGVPHGQAVSITLPHFLDFNLGVVPDDCNDIRGVDFVKENLSHLAKLLNGSSGLKKLFKEVGLKTKLSQLNIKYEDIGVIVKNGFTPSRVKNNPRSVTEISLNELLESIY